MTYSRVTPLQLTEHQEYLDVTEPKYTDVLQYLDAYADSPIYPWLVLGVKAMTDSVIEYNPTNPRLYWQSIVHGYDRFLYLVIYGYWCLIPVPLLTRYFSRQGSKNNYASEIVCVLDTVLIPLAYEGRHLAHYFATHGEPLKTNNYALKIFTDPWRERDVYFLKTQFEFVNFFRGILNDLEEAGFKNKTLFDYFRSSKLYFVDQRDRLHSIDSAFDNYRQTFKHKGNEKSVKELICRYYQVYGDHFVVGEEVKFEYSTRILHYSYGEDNTNVGDHLIDLEYGKEYHGILLSRTMPDQETEGVISACINLEDFK